MTIDGSSTAPLIAVWGARVSWLMLAVLGGEAIGQALAPHDRSVQLTGTIGCWIGWGVVALALLVPSTVGLTVTRSIVPAALVVAGLAAIFGDDVLDRAVCLASAVVAAVFVVTAEFGEVFVQASAYGDERRFLLRPPLGFLAAVVVSWMVLCAATIAGPLLVASGIWIAGVLVCVIALALGWFVARRFHRLSRRWVVVVPAGLVIHDQVVLAETSMFTRATLAHVALALTDTQAADLTGPAAGMAVEISVDDVPTVVLAPSRENPRGKALHVRSVLVAPSRPGRLLSEVARRGFPVG